MQNLQGNVLNNSSQELLQLVNTYRTLRKIYNNNDSTVIELENAYSEFYDSILYPIQQNMNSTFFLDKCRQILRNINDALTNRNPNLPYLSTFLEKEILPMLKNRIDVARLDENVFNGFGSLGGLNNFNDFYLQNRFKDINL